MLQHLHRETRNMCSRAFKRAAALRGFGGGKRDLRKKGCQMSCDRWKQLMGFCLGLYVSWTGQTSNTSSPVGDSSELRWQNGCQLETATPPHCPLHTHPEGFWYFPNLPFHVGLAPFFLAKNSFSGPQNSFWHIWMLPETSLDSANERAVE